MTSGILGGEPPIAAIDEVVASQGLPRHRRWAVAPGALCSLLALAMTVLRAVDGPSVFLDGVVARGAAVSTLLTALPLGFRLAKAQGGPFDPGLVGLVGGYGVGSRRYLARAARLVARGAMLRALVFVAPLALLAAALSLPSPALVFSRLGVGLALCGVAALSAAGLALLGLGAAFASQRRGQWLFVTCLLAPWVMASALDAKSASLPGLWRLSIDAALRLAP